MGERKPISISPPSSPRATNMAKEKEEVKEVSESSREKRWKAYVEAYKQKNPVKGAAKEKNGEFNKIPDSFK